MAKTKAAATEVPPETTEASTSTLTYGEAKLDANELPAHAIMYLLQYGLNKSRQDSVAGMAKEMKGEEKDGVRVHSDEDIAKAIADAQEARLQAILSGTLGTRTRGAASPKATSFEAVVKKVAMERIRALAAAKGKDFKLPTGEALATLVANFTEKFREDIEAEAKRRMAVTVGGEDEDLLGDLLG